jgi:hypothetical protein
MKRQLTSLSLLVALVAAIAVFASPPTAMAQSSPTAFDVLWTGATGTFDGTFDIDKFLLKKGKIFAVGTLTGTVLDATGAALGTVTDVPIRIPLLDATATALVCDILHLELGPLDLDLLGLVIHLDQVVLDITAQPGAGNLLGNLLCAIAGLLDGGVPLPIITDLLNALLDILNFLG